MGAKWEPRKKERQAFSRNITEYTYQGPCIPVLFLLSSWASLFGGSHFTPFMECMLKIGYCPLSHSWIIIIIWLYIALNMTPKP